MERLKWKSEFVANSGFQRIKDGKRKMEEGKNDKMVETVEGEDYELQDAAQMEERSIWNITSMNSENKSYFLKSYVAKIKEMNESYVNPRYYDILNVSTNSDGKMIRKSYLLLSKLFSVHKKLSSEHEECYYLIQKAYRILNDKFEKFYYDVLNGYYIDQSTIETCRKELEEEADLIYQNKINELKNVYVKKIKEEEEKNGLIIEKALFGNLTLKEEYINNCLNMGAITENYIQGPFLDFTIILQSRIENSSLLFNEDFSFAHFCDIPKPLIKISANGKMSYPQILENTEMYLYIKYKFLNVDHELIVVDRSSYTLPQRSHRIFGNRISGPFSPVNVIKMKHMSNSVLDTIFHFFSKNKFYITLLTTIILCAQSMKSR
ncbi:DnaJ domain containing protein [Plasmodium gonderi]|uniref:DnaJ domain containing protein n=1 Tax=Plasmodium gonderi TaxID=77519 RepID=A0A1Y1JHV2_PLAGO|nr:DnaJ domain containing protein [Plasmodium gonderi]GAW81820.1 DnaJ domain containing protein [Plasmodium gonderi]